jgi:glycosyltransferase involved in cell wall biosynthesis
MQDPRSLWIVVPAYNEAASIGRVVASLRLEGYSVVVVDDGSCDQTAEIARAAGATVLRHLLNLGQGGALQTGITFCLESGARYICTFDADGQHCAEDVGRMWERLLAGGYDIVLGSRFLGATPGMPLSRKLLLKMAVLFTRLHSGMKLTDSHNGLRVMTAEAASQLSLKQLGMAHASEIIDQIASLKLKYSEAPVTVLYTDYSKAKGQSALGSVRILMDLLIGRMLR